jgi:uncharacterized membrane protein YeaQ/YmgE (transglycosylase-associated protein family)
VQGTGFGIIGDLIIGIVGAFIGSWLLPQLGIHLGAGIVAAIINATIGALILLLIIRLLRGGGGWRWGGSWGPRFRERLLLIGKAASVLGGKNLCLEEGHGHQIPGALITGYFPSLST